MVIEILSAIVFGLLIGNYATTVYHRLPIGKPINGVIKSGMKPHCSKCGHLLKFYEYYPLLSWFATRFRFKCNYCKAPIEMTYFYLEFSTMCIAVIFAATFGLTPYFIFAVFIFVTLLLLIALFVKHKKIYKGVALFEVILIISIIIISVINHEN